MIVEQSILTKNVDINFAEKAWIGKLKVRLSDRPIARHTLILFKSLVKDSCLYTFLPFLPQDIIDVYIYCCNTMDHFLSIHCLYRFRVIREDV